MPRLSLAQSIQSRFSVRSLFLQNGITDAAVCSIITHILTVSFPFRLNWYRLDHLLNEWTSLLFSWSHGFIDSSPKCLFFCSLSRFCNELLSAPKPAKIILRWKYFARKSGNYSMFLSDLQACSEKTYWVLVLTSVCFLSMVSERQHLFLNVAISVAIQR